MKILSWLIKKVRSAISLLVDRRKFNSWLINYQYTKRQPYLHCLPHTFDIENTAFCNLRCIMCPYGEITRPKGTIDIDLFKKIILEIRHFANLVGLPVFGEPLIDKNVAMKIRLAKRYGIPRVHISTNASFLDAWMSLNILESGLDSITISLDATNSEIYKQVRCRGDYNTVIENINTFLKLKGFDKPYTTLQLIDFSPTHGDVEGFKDQWGKNQYVNKVAIKPLSYWPLSRVNLRETEVGFFKNSPKLERKPCLALWNSLVIYWNGDVVPCCRDWNGEYIVGNIGVQSLRQIWNGKKMVKLRQLHIEGRFNEINLCKDCIDWYGY